MSFRLRRARITAGRAGPAPGKRAAHGERHQSVLGENGAPGERDVFGWQWKREWKQLQGRSPPAVLSQKRSASIPSEQQYQGLVAVLTYRSIRFQSVFSSVSQDVSASPSGCCRSGQARTIQASTILEVRMERIERMRKRSDRCSAMGRLAWRVLLPWLAIEAAEVCASAVLWTRLAELRPVSAARLY